ANGILVIGGEPGAGSDSLTVTGTAGSDTIGVNLSAGTVTGIAGGAITLNGIEHLTVNGNGGGANGDSFNVSSLGALIGLLSVAINGNNQANDTLDIAGTSGPDTL